ncbi:unnamed protein product [Linum trigynum]|uniref:Secreted protein n=1 Tax=Linum trigynum TaxID=586398 RepID=A0AAV2E8F1_9ROSI
MRGALSSLLELCLRMGQVLRACLTAMLEVALDNQKITGAFGKSHDAHAVEAEHTPGRTTRVFSSGQKRKRPKSSSAAASVPSSPKRRRLHNV